MALLFSLLLGKTFQGVSAGVSCDTLINGYIITNGLDLLASFVAALAAFHRLAPGRVAGAFPIESASRAAKRAITQT